MMCKFKISTVIRLSKAFIVFTVAMLALLVVFGNVTDYNTNFQFVTHVMSMDTTPQGNGIMYRAITNPMMHNIAYIGIILLEALIMLICFKGSYDMYKNRHATAEEFHQSKRCAVLGLTICCLVWFLIFQVFAAEWFGMWMGKWNGLPDATRLVTYMFLALIYIVLKVDD